MSIVLGLVGLLLIAPCVEAESMGCHEHDVSPVRDALRYVGPSQRVYHGKVNFKCFQAQHWEDLFMFQNFFANITEGFFIELGALDGWSYSVSYFFEQFLHWKGLLIEASPKNYQLYRSRMKKLSPKHRRKNEFLLTAVCNNRAGEPVTYVSKEGTGAGILEFMPEDQQRRNKEFCKEVSVKDSEALINNPRTCYLTKINCSSLTELLAQRNIVKVDMFVLDVEGAEFEVLSSIDLDKVIVHFFLIELDGKAPEKDAMVRCILRQYNYHPIGRLDLNEIWQRRDFSMENYEYGAPVSPRRWEGCFAEKIEPSSFFNRESQLVAAAGGGGRRPPPPPPFEENLDPSFASFSVQGTLPGGIPKDDFESGGDVMAATAPFIVILFPILFFGYVILRRKRNTRR
jgi:FkbM family methyltransferase